MNWIKTYFGDKYAVLSPKVVLEGDRVAVVQITNPDRDRLKRSRTGFILVRKNGRYGSDKVKPLHEGTLKPSDFDRIKAKMEEEDTK